MNFKRIIAFVLSVACVFAVLSSCASDDKSASSKNPSSAAGSDKQGSVAGSDKQDSAAGSSEQSDVSSDAQQSSAGSGAQQSDVSSNKQSSAASSSKSTSSAKSSSQASSAIKLETYAGKSITIAQSNSIYGHAGNENPGYETYSGTRTAWLWPFTRTSCWNMPIGSNAKYQAAGLEAESEFSVDEAILLTTKSSDEYLKVMQNNSGDYNNRWPNKNQLKSQLNWKTKQQVYTYWPKGKVIAAGSYNNDCTTILQPNGKNIVEVQPICRADASSDYIVGNVTLEDIDIYSDIGNYGSHWGSAISNLGGCIRLGELTSDEPIRHAIKLNVWAEKYLYPAQNDKDTNAYRWPASRTDTTSTAKGKNKNLVEGSLLALPRNLTPESLGIKSKVGRKLFYAFQDYGAYIVDDTVRSAYAISAETGVAKEVRVEYGIDMTDHLSNSNGATKNYGNDLMKIIENLHVITNNTKDNIGGGGTPCQPLAPDLPLLK